MLKNILFLLACLLLTGCHIQLQQTKPLVADRAETYLYLSALPREARVGFTLQSVSAERVDGVEVPMTLRLGPVLGGGMPSQRMLASLPLPLGSYSGFVLRFNGATIKGEQGESALLLPESPIRVPFLFEVRSGKGLLVTLSLDHARSVSGGVRFTPSFSARIPGRPLLGLTGYVTNFSANTITVFDKKALEAVDVIQTGRGPAGIVIDQRARRAYVALAADDAVDVIDINQGGVVNRIPLNPGDGPRDLAITPDGTLLVTANSGSNSVSLLDPSSLTEVTRISLTTRPESVLMDRSGRRAYLFHTMNNSVSVLDIATRTIVASLDTDATPHRGDFNRKGDRLIVFHNFTPYLLVYDAIALTLQKRVYDDIGIGWIKVDTNSDRFYVGKKGLNIVKIFDPFSFIATDSLVAGGGVSYMTIDGEENNLYLLLPELRRLQIVNLVSKKTVGEIDLDDNPYWVTLMGER